VIPPHLQIPDERATECDMSDPFFFGYGSLVNRQTHVYSDAHRATLRGWRREWRYCNAYTHTFLSVVRDDTCQIDGLIARVPRADWAALDTREEGYTRHAIAAPDLDHAAPHGVTAQIYAVPLAGSHPASGESPILLSYLDVVTAGFWREYGADGVARFYATTTGWTDILDDRAQPRYPRAQNVGDVVTGLVDAHLGALGVRVVRV
jgi:hypothetical protein